MTTKVICAGVFDLLHPGHVELFRFAKSINDGSHVTALILSDTSTLRIKGRKTIMNENERALMVQACRYVDRVEIVYRSISEGILDEFEFDVLVAEDNSRYRHIIGDKYNAIFKPRTADISTCSIVERIKPL